MEIEHDVLAWLRNHDEEYREICEKIFEMDKKYPFIAQTLERHGKIALTKKEHKILVEYCELELERSDMERRQIYFQGHTDGYSYLKKIGAV